MGEQIVIIEDTRNKQSHHRLKNEYFARKGIRVFRSKLPAADYALLTNMRRVIDTKQSMAEVYSDLIQQHERFRREADFCMENGLELVILVEDEQIRRLDDVKSWVPSHRKKTKNRKPPVSGEQLHKIMKTFAERHGVTWIFCRPESAGRAILFILTGVDYGI